ncbi:MAG: VanZ family protein [Phycisphaera sp.]|nr:MAG: VanZ family protein [Phycisphaera sp.]
MIGRHRLLLRVVFVAYAVVLFVATHKPGVDVNVVPGWRLDLLIHMAAFGLWTFLLGLTGFAGDARRLGDLLVLITVGMGYAVADESSQALPIFERVFDLTDMVANAAGAILASLLVFFTLRMFDHPEAPQP